MFDKWELSVIKVYTTESLNLPISVAARSKAWVCGPRVCWNYEFESCRGHRCLFLVIVFVVT